MAANGAGDRKMNTGLVFSLSGLLFLITITPGPNNLILMHAGASGSLAQAGRVVLAIQSGGLLVLSLVWLGLSGLIAADDGGVEVFQWFGPVVLILLGNWILFGKASGGNALPSASMIGLAFLQLVNPKSWMLVVSLLSLAGEAALTSAGWAVFLTLFALVPLTSQFLWLLAGQGINRLFLRKPRYRCWFDRITGLALVAAGLLSLAILAADQ